jgi:thiol-disulfide isomerase/thioredoxin
VVVFLLTLIGATTADQPTARAALRSLADHKPGSNFGLTDSSGGTIKPKDYCGKVVLLDFWATWFHGCKEEIPWFSEFERENGPRGFAVVGVSMDAGGWES